MRSKLCIPIGYFITKQLTINIMGNCKFLLIQAFRQGYKKYQLIPLFFNRIFCLSLFIRTFVLLTQNNKSWIIV